MDTGVLKNLGFTQSEISIYLALLKVGESKAAGIIEQTNLANSVVHLSLKRMIGKGIVSFRKKGNVRYFIAASPDQFQRILDEQQEALNKIKPQLQSLISQTPDASVRTYQGFNGFKSLAYEFIEGGEQGDEFLFFTFAPKSVELYPQMWEFFETYRRDRDSKGLVVKGLAPKKLEYLFKKKSKRNVKFVTYPIPLNIAIFQDQLYFVPWDKKNNLSFLLRSPLLAKQMREFFYSVWDQE